MKEKIAWLREQLDETEETIRYCLAHGEDLFRADEALVDIAARRRILDRYEDCMARQTDSDYSTTVAIAQATEYEDWIIPAIAQSFAQRPGYPEGWRT